MKKVITCEHCHIPLTTPTSRGVYLRGTCCVCLARLRDIKDQIRVEDEADRPK